MNQNKYKSQISPEILAKKLNEVVKEANEEQNKDAQETKDEQLTTALQVHIPASTAVRPAQERPR